MAVSTGAKQVSDAGIDDGVRDFTWALGAVMRSLLKATRHAVSDLPGGPRGYQVLSMAVEGACWNQAAIAERLGLDRTVMTHLIDDLEDAGMVVRRPDPADRRARRIEPTAKGQAAYEKAAAVVRRNERHALAGLDDAGAAAFRELLFRAAAGVIDPPRDACDAATGFEANS